MNKILVQPGDLLAVRCVIVRGEPVIVPERGIMLQSVSVFQRILRLGFVAVNLLVNFEDSVEAETDLARNGKLENFVIKHDAERPADFVEFRNVLVTKVGKFLEATLCFLQRVVVVLRPDRRNEFEWVLRVGRGAWRRSRTIP